MNLRRCGCGRERTEWPAIQGLRFDKCSRSDSNYQVDSDVIMMMMVA